MISKYDLLIYLDEALTKNLNSLIIDGYIEKRTSRWIEDRTVSTGVRMNERGQFYEEDRFVKDERDGYKGKNFTQVDTNTDSCDNGMTLDGRRYVRREEELTRIYTTFELHQQLVNGLNNSNLIKTLSGDLSSNTSINVGDYIEIDGIISSNSVVSYIDAFYNMMNCFGVDNLCKFCKNIPKNNANIDEFTSNNIGDQSNILNFQMMFNQLNYLKTLLNNNNNQDIIINTGNNDIVVTVNNSCFLSSYANAYDKVECPCKIIGKVIKKCSTTDCIHLLRKTGQPNYYEKLLNWCNPLRAQLENSGIIIPEEPKWKVEGESLLIIPISLCI